MKEIILKNTSTIEKIEKRVMKLQQLSLIQTARFQRVVTQHEPFFHSMELYLQMKKTTTQLDKLNKIYAAQLNEEMMKFDRFKSR